MGIRCQPVAAVLLQQSSVRTCVNAMPTQKDLKNVNVLAMQPPNATGELCNRWGR